MEKQKAKAYETALEKAKRLYEKGTITESLCYIFPELKESEDEKIRKLLIRLFTSNANEKFDDVSTQEIIAWLEKQGEQKPMDKVEPKFHEGDWISGYYTNYRVTAINSKGYVVEDTDGNKINILFENEKFHHLFTIADAKDGDVLVDMHGNIGIFQECEDVFWHSYIYLGCDGTLRGFSIGGSHEQTDTHPATKEQSDNIMKAMADAGYEWDAEKKELKKVEPKFKIKLAGREYNVLEIKESAGVTFYGIEDEPNHIDYVLSDDCEIISGYGVKEKGYSYPTKSATFSEQTSAWNEEDEKIALSIEQVMNCASLLNLVPEKIEKVRAWLKSIKQRIGG